MTAPASEAVTRNSPDATATIVVCGAVASTVKVTGVGTSHVAGGVALLGLDAVHALGQRGFDGPAPEHRHGADPAHHLAVVPDVDDDAREVAERDARVAAERGGGVVGENWWRVERERRRRSVSRREGARDVDGEGPRARARDDPERVAAGGRRLKRDLLLPRRCGCGCGTGAPTPLPSASRRERSKPLPGPCSVTASGKPAPATSTSPVNTAPSSSDPAPRAGAPARPAATRAARRPARSAA